MMSPRNISARSLKSAIDAFVLPTVYQKIIAEVVGTYILIFTVCGSILVDQTHIISFLGRQIVAGLTVMALIFTIGHISGAHINPAVTIGLAAARKFPWKLVPAYIVAQLVGSTTASLTLKGLFRENIHASMTVFSSPTLRLHAIVWECIISFILMFVILGATFDHRAVKEVTGIAVGAVVLFNGLLAGPTTGASMNPARSIGPAIASGLYHNLWVYVISPIIGMLVAVMIYSTLTVKLPDNKIAGAPDQSPYHHEASHAQIQYSVGEVMPV